MPREQITRAGLIGRFLRGSAHHFVSAVVFSLAGTALGALLPQIVKVAVDSILGGQPSFLDPLLAGPILGQAPGTRRDLLLAAGLILFISALAWLSQYLYRVSIARGSERFTKSMRDTLYSHIQKLPYAWHMTHQTGEIIQRCTSDVEVVRSFVSSQLLEVFRTSSLLGISLWVMFSMNVSISLIATAFLPLILLYSAIFYRQIARRFLAADEAEGELSSVVQENLTGVRVVRAFGREQFELDRFDEKNTGFAKLWIKLGYLQSYYWGIGDMITSLQIIAVIVAGTVQATSGAITLGEFLAFCSYNLTLIWPVRSLGRILSEMSKAGVSMDRVRYILNCTPESDRPGAQRPPMDRDISFSHVTFGYDRQKPLLHDISFTIPAGTTLGILGDTGSGKSTLIHLLDRLYDLPPDGGHITIGGADIADIELAWLRRNIGMVLQEPFLFSRTVHQNIAATHPDASPEEVRRAASTACVHSAIDRFPDGYDTLVGERGVTLSGGQKQRVAIARMLMQNAPIMVLDDSLSAVDAETDAKIRAALDAHMHQSTVILISHRITTLLHADCIMVLDGGRIAEMGTHQQLLQKGGIYRSIYDLQLRGEDAASLKKGGVGREAD